MERDQYELMFQQEERHWWYIGMRRIAQGLLERFFRPESGRPEVLDAGCGSGGTTAWLRRWGRVSGIDVEPEALELARRRGIKRLLCASIEAMPFAAGSFDLVACFDVLYHLRVQDDVRALAEFSRVLRPGGLLLVRAPAHDWLRGAHDRAVHTRHRYHRDELTAKLRAVGFVVERASYANCLLFPLAPAKRIIERQNPAGCIDLWQPPASLNVLLGALLSLEATPAARFGLPWGLSVIAVGRKPGPTACTEPADGSSVQDPVPSAQAPGSSVSTSEPRRRA
jgi:SAM-dependent methyltransferase